MEDVKLFIEWCKENKVKSFKSEHIQFELSELSFLENTEGYADKIQTTLDESKFEKNNRTKKTKRCFFGLQVDRITYV